VGRKAAEVGMRIGKSDGSKDAGGIHVSHSLLTKRHKAFTYVLIECGVTPRSMIATANPNLRSRKVFAYKSNMFPRLPVLSSQEEVWICILV